MTVYGIPPLSPEERQETQNELYRWLRATIEAELINPNPDWGNTREQALIKLVAASDLTTSQREELVNLFENKGNE